MKQIIFAVSLTAGLAMSSVTIAAEEQGKSKEPEKIASNAEHVMFSPGDLKWSDAHAALPAGAKVAKLEGDPSKEGPFTIRLQMPDGYKIPPHTHPAAERVTVISGTFYMGTGPKFNEAAGHVMTAGAFTVMPAGMQHFAWSKGEAIVQVHGMGPLIINYVNPADDPRQAKK